LRTTFPFLYCLLISHVMDSVPFSKRPLVMSSWVAFSINEALTVFSYDASPALKSPIPLKKFTMAYVEVTSVALLLLS
ncbi:hypothetical protein KI387_000366, partial [Taxus chinensis]